MDENEQTASDDIEIRKMTPADAVEAAALSGELGYPVTANEMECRIRELSKAPAHTLFVACSKGAVIGWIDVGIVQHLQSDPYGEIGGLVVSAAAHGRGIGKRLVSAAEVWIAQQRLKKVLVRSQIKREGAHAFYLRQGFEVVKTSLVFMKAIEEEHA